MMRKRKICKKCEYYKQGSYYSKRCRKEKSSMYCAVSDDYSKILHQEKNFSFIKEQVPRNCDMQLEYYIIL